MPVMNGCIPLRLIAIQALLCIVVVQATDVPTMQPTLANNTENPTSPAPSLSPTDKDKDEIQKISIFYIVGAGVVLVILVILFYHCCCKANEAKRKIAAAMKEDA